MLHLLCASRPETAYAMRVLPGLGDIAWIYGDSLPVALLEQAATELEIEIDPLKALGKP